MHPGIDAIQPALVYPAGMAYSKFHSSRAWKKARRVVRIEHGHRCSNCGRFLPKGLHVHHRKPYTKAPALAFEPANLEPLCGECHNRLEPRSGRPARPGACDEQGYALNENHPWFQDKGGHNQIVDEVP
jgi:hypothetical protein